MLQETECVLEPETPKQSLVSVGKAGATEQQYEATYDVPHTITILTRVRRPRHEQLAGAQAVL